MRHLYIDYVGSTYVGVGRDVTVNLLGLFEDGEDEGFEEDGKLELKDWNVERKDDIYSKIFESVLRRNH